MNKTKPLIHRIMDHKLYPIIFIGICIVLWVCTIFIPTHNSFPKVNNFDELKNQGIVIDVIETGNHYYLINNNGKTCEVSFKEFAKAKSQLFHNSWFIYECSNEWE